MSVCLCACAHVYVGVFLCYSLPLKSKQGLSLSWSTEYQLTGQQTPKSTSSTSAGVADAHCHAQLCMWVCGIRNQDLMLTLQLRTCNSGPWAHLQLRTSCSPVLTLPTGSSLQVLSCIFKYLCKLFQW